MNYLNFVLDKRPVFESNPEFLAIPEFEALTERQIRYVMLVDWFKTPLRLMKLDDRKHKAAIMSGYKMEKDGARLDVNARNLVNGKTSKVEAARKIMLEIQYDEEADLLDAINTQIQQIIVFLRLAEKTPVQLDKAVQLMGKLPTILETKQKLLSILNYREPEAEVIQDNVLVVEDQVLSELDEWQEEQEN